MLDGGCRGSGAVEAEVVLYVEGVAPAPCDEEDGERSVAAVGDVGGCHVLLQEAQVVEQ